MIVKNAAKTIKDNYNIEINNFMTQQTGFDKQIEDHSNVLDEFAVGLANNNFSNLTEQNITINSGNLKNFRSNYSANIVSFKIFINI